MPLNLDDYQNEETWIGAVRGIQTSENGPTHTSYSKEASPRVGLTTPAVADAMSGMLLYKPRGATYDLFNQRLSQQLAGLRSENNPEYNYSDHEHKALSPYDVFVGPPGDTSFGLSGVGVGAAVAQAGNTAATSTTTPTPTGTAGNGNVKMIWPTENHTVNSGYGPRGGGFHDGLDINSPSGSTVVAPLDGVVTPTNENFRQNIGGYGDFFLVVKHAEDLYTLYGHIKQRLVTTGDVVKQGQPIAISGGGDNDPGKGSSRGAHLHFETLPGPYGTKAVDPMRYLS